MQTVHTNHQKFLRALALICVAVLCLGAARAGFAVPAPGAIAVLSGRSVDNRHPVIAVSPDGLHTFVAWEGVLAGQRRILLREAVDGAWLPEIIVDTEPTADNQIPSVAVDEAGNPHVAWAALDKGHYVAHYAARIGGVWTTTALQHGENVGDCDYVNVRVDDQGSPWIVWQSANGNAYQICTAFVDLTGSFHVECLTPGSLNHNLYPDVAFDPEPTVLWYAGREDGFFLVGERYVRATGEWGDARLAELDRLPGEPLPQLARWANGPLTAFWYEKPANTDTVDVLDRVYVGQQGRSEGAGEQLDQPLDGSNSRVSGAVAAGNLAAAWCTSSLDDGTQIYAAFGRSAAESTAIKFSDGEEMYYSNPRVSAWQHGFSVVWESTEAEGGDGQIYYRSAPAAW
jgi:hypothetical protein